MPQQERKFRLEVVRCGAHPDFWAVCLSDDHGGTRLTPSKCCGRWDGITRKSGTPTMKGPYVEWRMSARQLQEASEAFANAAELARGDEESLEHERDRHDAEIPRT